MRVWSFPRRSFASPWSASASFTGFFDAFAASMPFAVPPGTQPVTADFTLSAASLTVVCTTLDFAFGTAAAFGAGARLIVVMESLLVPNDRIRQTGHF